MTTIGMMGAMLYASISASACAQAGSSAAPRSVPSHVGTNPTTALNVLLAVDSARRARRDDVRPFRAHVSDKALTDLRRRIQATRWADTALVADSSQDVQFASLRALVNYWGSGYDWRKAEAKLNALPQFMTRINGLDIHFIHVRSRHKNAVPIIITHGWAGSIIEQLKIIGPLTDPIAYGGTADDAFDVVIPSLPGYGFSGKPNAPGWSLSRIAFAWDTLMKRLGYAHYAAQGGDEVGLSVTEAMGRLGLEGLAGIHLSLFLSVASNVAQPVAANAPPPDGLTIGHRLADSPAGLAAWIVDHDAPSYARIAQLFVDKEPYGALTRDDVLDNITLYWLTNTGTSARLYWESERVLTATAGAKLSPVTVPVAISVFPEEIGGAPRRWVEAAYPTLVYYHQVDKGGHFAAWEQPELFATELRAAFQWVR